MSPASTRPQCLSGRWRVRRVGTIARRARGVGPREKRRRGCRASRRRAALSPPARAAARLCSRPRQPKSSRRSPPKSRGGRRATASLPERVPGSPGAGRGVAPPGVPSPECRAPATTVHRPSGPTACPRALRRALDVALRCLQSGTQGLSCFLYPSPAPILSDAVDFGMASNQLPPSL